MRRCCGGLFSLVLRLLVVAAAIGGLVAPDAVAKSFPPRWPQSPGTHAAGAHLAPRGIASPAYAANLRGGFAIVGNTLLTCPENLLPPPWRPTDAITCSAANNNDKSMRYVNVDPGGNPARFNSSTATLSVPAGASVAKAFLYWGADLARGVTSNTANDGAPGGENPSTNTLWQTVFLKTGTGPYTMIDATQADRHGLEKGIVSWYEQPGNRPGYAYQVRADVTNEIRAAVASTTRHSSRGASLVDATVANVQAGIGNNRHGGWTLVVVWENNASPWRNLTLFDGFDFVQVQGGQQLVVGPLQFSGFKTPSSGNVDAHIATWTYEADRYIVGDYMSLGAPTNSCSDLSYRVHDALNPVDNFFNSSITRGGVRVTSKVPDFENQLGFDIDAPSIPEGTIKNGATGAAVCLGTNGDTYFFGGLAFDTLIRAPNLSIAKTVNTAQPNQGDVVTYTVTVTNPQRPEGQTPTDVATNVVVSDPIPSGLDFVDFVVNPTVPPPGPQVPACGYSAAAISITCKAGLTFPPDASFTYSFRARVSGAAPPLTPILNTACFRANSQDQPTTNFTGCDSANIYVKLPPSPAPLVDLGVTKTVSAETVKPGDNLVWTLDARNFGPDASTNFTVADVLPSSVAFVSLATSPSGLTCTTPPVGSSGEISCTAAPASVPAGSGFTLTIVGQVSAATADGTVLSNLATVAGTEAEPVPDQHQNRDRAFSRVVVPDQPLPPEPPAPLPVPDPDGDVVPAAPVTPAAPPPPPPAGTTIALTKSSAPARVPAGGNVTFTLKVCEHRRRERARRQGVRRPAGIGVARLGTRLQLAGGKLCRSAGTLLHSASKTFEITVRVSPGAPSRIVNTATATASNAKSASGKATIHVEPPVTSAGGTAGVTG